MRQQLAACGSSSSSSSSCWLRPLTPHVPASRPSCSGISSSSSSGCGSAGSARLTPGELAPGRATRATRVAAAGGGGGGERPGSDRPGSSNTGGRPHEPRRSKPERKARKPGLFEVRVMTPPPRSLGVYALPPLTHNGEHIEIDGHGYVVTGLVLQYKLQRGRYVREHSRLEVQPTGRWLLNMMLDNIYHAKYMGPTGSQD